MEARTLFSIPMQVDQAENAQDENPPTLFSGGVLMRPPAGWFLKSVSQDGNDVTDTGVDFAQGQKVSNLEIILTQRTSALT